MFIRSLVTALVAASPVFSLAIDQLPKIDGDLKIELSSAGNTLVKASITSKADQTISLAHINSFFDASPVQKVDIIKNDKLVPFEGIFRYYKFDDLPLEAFTPIKPGETIHTQFDIAETADLSGGGTYTVSAHGAIPFSNGTSTKVIGTLTYKSNDLDVKIDGPEASKVTKRAKAFAKRTIIDGGTCKGEQKKLLDKALLLSRDYAIAGTDGVNDNPQKFKEYFHADDEETRKDAILRFFGIAVESSSGTAGFTNFFCEDKWDWCEGNVIAYTLPSDNYIVTCPGFWTLPEQTDDCHAPDQGYVILHEMTHAPAIKEPWCQDHAYGYDAIRKLTPKQAINNADTFALFAGAMKRRC